MKKTNIEIILPYYNEGLNDIEIAKILNVTRSCITYQRKIHNLKSNFTYKTKINSNEFLGLRAKGLSDIEIYDYYLKQGISKKYLSYIRLKLKLPPKKKRDIILTQDEIQVIVGSTLGDATLAKTCTDKSNTYFKFTHGHKQKDYAIWKEKIIQRLVSNSKDRVAIDKRSNTEVKTYNVCTFSHPVFNYYYNIFYKNKKKEVTLEILNLLNPLGIAIWYQDDGYYSTGRIGIATNGFSYESLEIIKKWFLDKYNIKCSIHKSKALYIWKQSNKLFFDIVNPYICENLKYKCPE